MRRLTSFLIVLVFLVVGCGSDSFTVQQAPVPAPPPPVATGDILVRFDLQPRLVLNTITGFRFIVFDAEGNSVFVRETGRDAEVRLSPVPVTGVKLRIELLRNGVVVGLFETAVVVTEGQTTTVANIDYSDVVAPALLAIQPGSAVLSVGQAASFVVISRPDDPQPEDVTSQATWSSSNPASLRVDGPGQVTALSAGVVTLTATFNEQTATAQVTVTNATITELRFLSTTGRVVGQLQLALQAVFSDGTVADVTQQASWSIDNPGVATVSNTVPSRGVVLTVSLGTAVVTARLGSLSATQSIQTVAGARLLSRNVTNDGPADSDATTGNGLGFFLGRDASADGLFVVVISDATNLGGPAPGGFQQVYLRDRQTNSYILVSVNPAGTLAGNGNCSNAVISADGRFVFFASTATNLTADAITGEQVFRRDLLTNTTTLVSLNADPVPVAADSDSFGVIASSNGSIIAFVSDSTNLPVTGANPLGDDQLLVRDLTTGTVTLANLDASNTPQPLFQSYALSGDGRFIAFDLEIFGTPPDPDRVVILVRNVLAGTSVEASTQENGAPLSLSLFPLLNEDGSEIVFFTAGESGLQGGSYAKRLDTGSLTFLHSGITLQASDDGRFLVSLAGGLFFLGVGAPEVFDRQTGLRSTMLVNSAGQLISAANSLILGSVAFPTISGDGRTLFLNSDIGGIDPLAGASTDFLIYELTNPFLP